MNRGVLASRNVSSPKTISRLRIIARSSIMPKRSSKLRKGTKALNREDQSFLAVIVRFHKLCVIAMLSSTSYPSAIVEANKLPPLHPTYILISILSRCKTFQSPSAAAHFTFPDPITRATFFGFVTRSTWRIFILVRNFLLDFREFWSCRLKPQINTDKHRFPGGNFVRFSQYLCQSVCICGCSH